MKLKMAQNSLFAILLRSPWWISFAIAGVLSIIALAILPAHLAPYAISGGLPFIVVGMIATYRQMRAPSATQVTRTLETVGAMSWRDFSAALVAAFQRDGYTVTPMRGTAADFELERGGRTALVSGKRWKANSHGVEPLRELHSASLAREAAESIYITSGALSENAQRYAKEKKIRIIEGVALVELLRPVLRSEKA